MKEIKESIVDLILNDELRKLKNPELVSEADLARIRLEDPSIKKMLADIARNQEQICGYVEIFTATQADIELYRNELVGKFGWDAEHDIRITILNQLTIVLIPYIANLYFTVSSLANHQYQINGLKATSYSESKRIIQIYHSSNQSMLLYNLCAIVERFLRLIAKTFDPAIVITAKFHPLRKQVFATLGIANDSDENQAVRLLNSMRNCIHNNGVHVEADREILYRGKSYPFVKNRAHNYATFENFNYIISDIFNIVKIVNENPVIQGHAIIEDLSIS